MGDSSDEFQDASCSPSRFIHHCGKCEISFSSSSSLRKHSLRLHQASCPVCSFKGTIGAVKAHRRLEHTRKERGQECVEKNAAGLPCGEKFLTLAKLRAHLASEHDISAATHCIKEQFTSETEFREWKGAYESSIGAQYTQRAGAVGQIRYFECSRSGIHKPDKKAQNGRKPKSQGSSKIGRRCTSTMTARSKEDGTVLVDVHPFHYGHCLGLPHLPHLRIPTQDKAAIKDKLRNGVSMTRIIQDIRKQYGEDPSTNRTYWIGRKDLRNMSASMGISAQGADVKSHNEDSSGSLQPSTDISTPTTVSDRQYMAVNTDQHSPTPSEHDRPEYIARRTALANRIVALGRMAHSMVDGIQDDMLAFITAKTRELEGAFKLAQTRAAAASTSLPPPSTQPWNKRPTKQPAFGAKKRRAERQTVAPAGSEDARAAVAALCQRDGGRERHNRKASDHTYMRGQ